MPILNCEMLLLNRFNLGFNTEAIWIEYFLFTAERDSTAMDFYLQTYSMFRLTVEFIFNSLKTKFKLKFRVKRPSPSTCCVCVFFLCVQFRLNAKLCFLVLQYCYGLCHVFTGYAYENIAVIIGHVTYVTHVLLY